MERDKAYNALKEIDADPVNVIEKYLGRHAAQYVEQFLPIHMHGAIARYIVLGLSPGSFLDGVLSNNLVVAASNADDMNSKYLKEWGIFIGQHMPRNSCGNSDKVRNWRGLLYMMDES